MRKKSFYSVVFVAIITAILLCASGCDNSEKGSGSFTVTFMNGDEVVSVQTVTDGKNIVEPPAPVKPGNYKVEYIFSGWDFKEYETLRSDKVVHAIFDDRIPVFKIFYKYNDETIFTYRYDYRDDPLQFRGPEYTSQIAIPGSEKTEGVWGFYGWYEDLENDVLPFDHNDPFPMRDITLHAKVERADDLEMEYFHYEQTERYYNIVGVNDKSISRIHIAPFYNGLNVLSNSENLFDGCNSLETIILSHDILTPIKNFLGSAKPKEIVFNSGSFYEPLLYGCNSVEKVSYRNLSYNGNQLAVRSGMFSGCTSLKTVELPAECATVESNSFNDCASLTSLSLPDSVINIESNAFNNCTSLESINIPAGVTNIETYAFYNCPKVSFSVAPENEKYIFKNECLIDKDAKKLLKGNSRSVIPQDGSVTSIDAYAFYYCEDLVSVTLPKGLEQIGQDAFAFCGITEVCYPASARYISSMMRDFRACPLESISVAEDNPYYFSQDNCIIEKSTSTLVMGCKNSVIPGDGSVTKLGGNSFADIESVKIIVPDTVNLIEYGAFGAASVRDLYILSNNLIVEENAFVLFTGNVHFVCSQSVADAWESGWNYESSAANFFFDYVPA